jgi:hypothetical protein
VPPIDQREVDYLRGFWAGAVMAVKGYPKRADRDWKRHLKEAMKEEDEPSGP